MTSGACGRSQRIQHRLLQRIGIDVRGERLAVDCDVDAPAALVGDDLDALGCGLGALCARGGQASDLDVAVPDAVSVILQEDEAVLQLAEPRDVLELALRDRCAQRRAVELVLQHASAVQVVLDCRPVRHDPALIELTGGPDRTILSGEDVIERRRLPMRADLRVGVPLIVDELVLVADGRIQVLEDEVLQAAVAALGDPPLPRQLEPVELSRRDDVALPTRVFPRAGTDGQQPLFNAPA